MWLGMGMKKKRNDKTRAPFERYEPRNWCERGEGERFRDKWRVYMRVVWEPYHTNTTDSHPNSTFGSFGSLENSD